MSTWDEFILLQIQLVIYQQEEIMEYDIKVVPLTIQIDDKTYVDGQDLQPDSFLQLMKIQKNYQKVLNLHQESSKNYLMS